VHKFRFRQAAFSNHFENINLFAPSQSVNWGTTAEEKWPLHVLPFLHGSWLVQVGYARHFVGAILVCVEENFLAANHHQQSSCRAAPNGL
jgi:hypothetical protein